MSPCMNILPFIWLYSCWWLLPLFPVSITNNAAGILLSTSPCFSGVVVFKMRVPAVIKYWNQFGEPCPALKIIGKNSVRNASHIVNNMSWHFSFRGMCVCMHMCRLDWDIDVPSCGSWSEKFERHSSLGDILRRETAGLQSVHSLSFAGCCQNAFQMVVPFTLDFH